MKKLNNLTKRKSFRQLFKYGIVGIIGLVIDMGVFYLLIKTFHTHFAFSEVVYNILPESMTNSVSVEDIDKTIASVISSTLAVINNFILNSYFTFRVTDNKIKRFISFASIATLGVAVSSLLLTIFIAYLGINDMVSKALSIMIVAAIQFVINKLFTFKSK